MSSDLVPFKMDTSSNSLAVMAKRHIRDAAAAAMYHLGLWRLCRAIRGALLGKTAVCCLGLHRVLTDHDFQRSNSLRQIVIREETFASLLEYLRANLQLVSLGQLLDGKPGNAAASQPICLLTFDDGWKDNYTTAFPLLKKYEIPATIFLVTHLVETGRRFWVERVNEVWKDPHRRGLITDQVGAATQCKTHEAGLEEIVEYLKHMSASARNRLLGQMLGDDEKPQEEVDHMMSWEQVAEMSRSGIEFGGHSVNHPLLTFEDDDTVARELQFSKRAIEMKLGVDARSFCYPNGDWDDRIRRKAQQVGYKCAFTTRSGWHRLGDDLFTIRRILIHEGNVTNRRGEFSPAAFNWTLGRRW
jgi:peptidoglycan/xylan/chitin deacetylase (PgdA/CDA1 family)